jgi:hypothetical protein
MNAFNPTTLAWRRFSKGLPPTVTSVNEAINVGLRSFEQWRTCLETANHHAERINRHVHRRAARVKPDNVARRTLRVLEDGQPHIADAISRTLGVHADVVRRTLKAFHQRRWVTTSQTYTRDQPRAFVITELGRAALEQQTSGGAHGSPTSSR